MSREIFVLMNINVKGKVRRDERAKKRYNYAYSK